MAQDSNKKIPHRRRREQKTDYQSRRKLLKSAKHRAVVRTSNKHTRVHLSHYKPEGDENTAQVISKQLSEYGWEQNTGNLPSAYLTGFLAGMKAGEDEAVLDIGTREKKNGGRIFAAVKGMNDAGLKVPVGEEAVPEQTRLRGEHIKEMRDEDVPSNFEEVKEKIRGDFE
jgi:large subunit ribosomal protein L18